LPHEDHDIGHRQPDFLGVQSLRRAAVAPDTGSAASTSDADTELMSLSSDADAELMSLELNAA
jgi:hypothetical protein